METFLLNQPINTSLGICHSRLLTNVERKTCHMTNDAACIRCGDQEETFMRFLPDCDHIREIWDPLIKEEHWLHQNLSSNDVGAATAKWNVFFAVMVWNLWKDKNNLIFKGGQTIIDSSLLASSNNMVELVVQDTSRGIPICSTNIRT